jgi:hypothetical protein
MLHVQLETSERNQRDTRTTQHSTLHFDYELIDADVVFLFII